MSAYTNLRPHVIFTPKLFIDGNKWCALYGENLMEGIAGFGDTPREALIDYDYAFSLLKSPEKAKPEEIFPGTLDALDNLGKQGEY